MRSGQYPNTEYIAFECNGIQLARSYTVVRDVPLRVNNSKMDPIAKEATAPPLASLITRIPLQRVGARWTDLY